MTEGVPVVEQRAEPAPVETSGATGVVACVDFGSTFTKAALVEVPTGRLLATAEHATTIGTDVLDGWHACRDALAASDPRAADAEVLACSSAGGGLRIAVVGNEALVTAEAGRRVALSSGGRVVHVASGGLDEAGLEELRASAPDVVLLVGGTDGGNSAVLLACARTLAGARWSGPVVVAGNVDVRDEVAALLGRAGTPHVLADNVVPRIGVLAPGSARAAIRAMFLSHVIGGKHLSASPDFAAMVRGATPDVVLAAVELLARGTGSLPGAGDVVVVDVGGATTDVYSVVEPVDDSDPEPPAGRHAEWSSQQPNRMTSPEPPAGRHAEWSSEQPQRMTSPEPPASGERLGREVVGTTPASRTVEGDLGVRWSAGSTVEEAVAAGFLSGTDDELAAAGRRHADPAYLPTSEAELAFDRGLAACAAGLALRRHAGRAQVRYDAVGGRFVERSGTDLREVALVVGSGGVLRQDPGATGTLMAHVSGVGGWQVPEHPEVTVDRDYVLAPAGLLAERHPEAAYRLLQALRGDAEVAPG